MEYFWETEHPFEEFCKKIFGNAFRRKFSLSGNGIYYLIDLDNKTYELKYTECKKALVSDDKVITDKNKDFIIHTIVENLKDNANATISGGKFITFKIDKFTAKIEVIKKLKEPI